MVNYQASVGETTIYFFTGRVSLSQGKHGSVNFKNNISPKWADYCVRGAWFCCGSDLLFGLDLSIQVYFHILLIA